MEYKDYISEGKFGGEAWQLYQLLSTHFLGS